eukprot:scaffold249816_cov14-Tisochrysis_lutea.AAC.1
MPPQETPTLLGPSHKFNANGSRQSPEEGGGGAAKPQDDYPSAQRAFENFKLETPPQVCPHIISAIVARTTCLLNHRLFRDARLSTTAVLRNPSCASHRQLGLPPRSPAGHLPLTG